MQLSNQPAEALAKRLVASGKGAFAACGFVSGGAYSVTHDSIYAAVFIPILIGSEAMEAVIKLARQVKRSCALRAAELKC